MAEYVIHREEAIIGLRNDTCSYRLLILSNGMKVLLISNSNFKVNGVALSVNVGHKDNPDNLPGLAHLCEHIIYSRREQNPYLLVTIVNNNGGIANALTYYDATVYYLITKPQMFKFGLCSLLRFFLEPQSVDTFSIENEVHLIDSEYMIRAMGSTDILGDWFYHFLRSSADEIHPLCKFLEGNKDTLDTIPKQENINVRNELMAFYNNYYSANKMCLCVCGPEDLNVLESMVEPFSQIRNKGIGPKRHCSRFWSPFRKRLRTKWYVIPPNETKELVIVFPLKDERDYDKYKPASYICYLLRQEQEGSLQSILKEYGWCMSLFNDVTYYGINCIFLVIEAVLTEEGVGHVDDIIGILFQYIRTVRSHLDNDASYKEYNQLSSFKTVEIPSTIHTVLHIVARKMHTCQTWETIMAQFVDAECNPMKIKNVIDDSLRPELIRVYVIANMNETDATETEKWYGTKYKRERISRNILDKWKMDYIDQDKFKHPIENTFMLPIPSIESNEWCYTPILLSTDMAKFWYKATDSMPIMCFEFVSSVATYDLNLLNVLILILEDSIIEYTYTAKLVGLTCEVTSNIHGITLTIRGYSIPQKMFEDIMNKIFNCDQINPRRFELLKEKYIRYLKTQISRPSIDLATTYLYAVLNQYLTPCDLLDKTDHLTIEAIQRFIPTFLRNMQMYCFIEGGINKDQFLYTVDIIKIKLSDIRKKDKGSRFYLPSAQHKKLMYHSTVIDHGSHFLFEIETKYQKTSCTLFYYQADIESLYSEMMLKILYHIISEYSLEYLKGHDQLGYDIRVQIADMDGSCGLVIAVVGHRYETQYVEEKLNKYLECVLDWLQMTVLDSHISHLENHPLFVRKLPTEPASYYKFSKTWEQVASEEYDIQYKRNVTQHIQIEKCDLIEYYKKLITAKSQRKVSIHVKSTIHPPPVQPATSIVTSTNSINAKKINDIGRFKSGKYLFLQSRLNLRTRKQKLSCSCKTQ